MPTSLLSRTAPDDGRPGSRSPLRLRGAGLGLACAGALLLTACTGEDPEESTTPGPTQSSPTESPAAEGSEAPTGEDLSHELPDPDQMDLEHDEELGAFFSEEEACMTVGATMDGLEEDLDGGIESQGDLDEAYEAVEQTYIYVPEDLRAPLEEILAELDGDHGELDEETVRGALEELEDWMDETCDGEYHNQDHGHEQGEEAAEDEDA